MKNPCIPLVAVVSLWPFALTFWHEGPESIYSDLRACKPLRWLTGKRLALCFADLCLFSCGSRSVKRYIDMQPFFVAAMFIVEIG